MNKLLQGCYIRKNPKLKRDILYYLKEKYNHISFLQFCSKLDLSLTFPCKLTGSINGFLVKDIDGKSVMIRLCNNTIIVTKVDALHTVTSTYYKNAYNDFVLAKVFTLYDGEIEVDSITIDQSESMAKVECEEFGDFVYIIFTDDMDIGFLVDELNNICLNIIKDYSINGRFANIQQIQDRLESFIDSKYFNIIYQDVTHTA